MKICVAQIKAIKANYQANIKKHKEFINLAASLEASTIIFPELSLTAYEPELAKELATSQNDARFDDFQNIANSKQITIGLGVPTVNDIGVCISMVLFQANKARQIYSKKYLHASEEDFFISGQSPSNLILNTKTAIAICYEISIPEHAKTAARSGAEIYIASIVESKDDIDKAHHNLANIAKNYSMTVLMSNCVGQSGIYKCAGKSSVWSNAGRLLGQLNCKDEGILIYDTETQEITSKYF